MIVGINIKFEKCDNCIHSSDTTSCIHAITNHNIKECYQPKGITISKSMFNACLDSMAKFEKIKKIVNTPFCEVEESEE